MIAPFILMASLAAGPVCTADLEQEPPSPSKIQIAKKAVVRELHRYAHDAKDLATSPIRWDRKQWEHFAEGTGAVAAVYAVDRRLYDDVQRNRSGFTNDFAKVVTPFGAQPALDLSALLIAGGVFSHNDPMRDAGRDSLEAEIWAGGVVTPLLKRLFGRARPSQEQGSHSFQPFSSSQSFPSGHATNAFAFATGIAAHYDGWLVPTIVYSLASGVAFSRVNDRAHFPSDVLAGALIGRAVAKGIVHRHQNNRSRWSIVPMFIDGRPGVGFHWTR
jgi:membrane-associated phospholipid phosphatase